MIFDSRELESLSYPAALFVYDDVFNRFTIRYDTIQYIYMRSKADETASLV